MRSNAGSLTVYVHFLVSRVYPQTGLPDVQRQGCYAVAKLAAKNAVQVDSFFNAGGIAIVLAAMESHFADAEVQAAVCFALYS